MCIAIASNTITPNKERDAVLVECMKDNSGNQCIGFMLNQSGVIFYGGIVRD
jgi:hypothetical protein